MSAAAEPDASGRTPLMTRGLTYLFAVAGGAAVGNLYWSQPLLDFIADDLGSSAATAGWLVTATQIGYAIGVLLIVPLGDVVNRRRLVPGAMLAAAIALLLCAMAPTMGALIVAVTVLGLTTVGGQLLTPLAGDLAEDSNRGAVVGTVVSGILTGILVSRILSGVVAQAFGWRAIYLLAAVLDLVLAWLLYRSIPTLPAKAHIPYPKLIASVATAVRRERAVRWTLALSAVGFALFTMFWTALTFLLSGPPFEYPVSVIGLFSLAGLVGAVVAQRAGVLHDRGWSMPATGVFLVMLVVSFVIAATASTSVVLIVVAILVLTLASQGVGVLNQTRLFEVSHEARSRLNTAFVTNNFIGGAIGSTLATVLWARGGWVSVSVAGVILSLLCLLIWAVGRRGPLLVGDEGAQT